MTAEVAIMNKEAIALAADSAVTTSSIGGKQKIFASVDKLFALSKYHPVGIMIYGSAKFMGIPWETIIKIYRNKLGKQKFNTLKKYAEHFIAFLENNNQLFPEVQQKKHLCSTIGGYFNYRIKEEIEKEVNSVMSRKEKITDTQIKQIVSNIIKKHYTLWEDAKPLPSITKKHIKDTINKYGDIIDKIIKEVFEEMPISAESLKQLRRISASLFSKFPESLVPPQISGIVIAGFGEKETFPSLKAFTMELIINNKLKYKEDSDLSAEISFDNSATIAPFAQRKMADTFMKGIDPTLEEFMNYSFFKMFDSYSKIIVESIEKLDDKEKKVLLSKLKKENKNMLKEYYKGVSKHIRNEYVSPVIEVVTALPKDELAKMAEALVSLTLIKLRFTTEVETVAGPIDVAVISKGDGFIWIKRKDYFDPKLNPQFFANYYREVENEKK